VSAGAAGPLTESVLRYAATIERLVPTVRTSADWAPLSGLVAVEDFVRVGTFLEVQDWAAYTQMLTAWAASVDSFATTLRRCQEVPGLLYYEVEERHGRDGTEQVVNSLTVFAFDDDRRISRLDVYLQQAR
jgi:hypothetical protein